MKERTKPILVFGIVIVAYLSIITGVYSQITSYETSSSVQELSEKDFAPLTSKIEINEKNPIKVGIIHSTTGTMAITETPVAESVLLAIEEINERGGILDRKVVPIIVDGKSDGDVFASEAEKLILDENVSVIFGGYTSESRKAMLPIFEKYDHLLFYPVQYEGLEQSPNIVYLGAAPNQQILAAADWSIENLGKKFYMVGSDYIYPRSANEILKYKIAELGGEVVGEDYKNLGDSDFSKVVQNIVEAKPDVILHTVVGDSNLYFFTELRKQGIQPTDIPTISMTIGAVELTYLKNLNMVGDYAAWNYFQEVDIPENKEFVKRFKEHYGSDRVISDPMEAAYSGVLLFEKAVLAANSDNNSEIQKFVKGQTLASPEGIIGIDPETQHTYKTFRIAQITDKHTFKIIHSTEEPIVPIPFPQYKTEQEWEQFLQDLYDGWDGNWSNPDDKQEGF